MRRHCFLRIVVPLLALASVGVLACAPRPRDDEEVVAPNVRRDAGAAGAAGAGTPAVFDPEERCVGTPDAPAASSWPAPLEVLVELSPPSFGRVGVAIDEEHLYFSFPQASKGGEIRRVKKTGGAVTVIATGQSSPQSIVVDATHVYWSNGGFDGSVMKLSKVEGSVPEVLQKGPSPMDIAQDEDWIYWSEISADTVGRTPKQGGPSVVLATDARGPQQVAVFGPWLYWGDYGTSRIMRVVKEGGPAEVVAAGQDYARGVAVDCLGVYWFGKDLLDRYGAYWLPWTGGPPQLIGQAPGGRDGHLALDARYLYSSRGPGGVVRVPRVGGAVSALPDTPPGMLANSVGNVAVDDTHVYWANNDTSRILRHPK